LLVTNDFENGTAEIYQAALPQGTIEILKPGETLASVTDRYPAERIVVDFGGWVEARVVEAAQAASVCVVPLCYQSTADLMPAVKTILMLQKYAKRLVILINNTEATHLPELRAVLTERFPDIPLFVVNRSRYIAKLADEGMTLFDLFTLGGLHAFALRNVIPQIKALYAHLDKCEAEAARHLSSNQPNHGR